MFEASHPFAFFDYFRTPYEVRPPTQGTSHAGAAAFVRTLTAVTRPGRAGRSLMWIGAEARPAAKNAAGQLGRYALDTFTFFGHVAPDAAVQAMLPGPEGRWHQAEPIRAGDDRPVAAIWRDADGNVFLPFDPGEVMRLFWSEGYRDIGRSAATAFAHAAALRTYYLIRPALPRPLQLAMRRQFTRVQAASPFPAWPIEDSLHDFYGWLFAGHPELRALFPLAMNEQRDRLFRALGRIVRSLSTPEELAAYLTQLGRDHRKYSVEPEMYEAVGDALMATLRAYAGPTFTSAAQEAWAQAYKAASSLMIESANKDSLGAPPFWTAEVVGNEQRRPGISPRRQRLIHSVERQRARMPDAEALHQRCLGRLTQLQRERPRAVQHTRATELKRTHQRQRQWDRPRVPSHIRARTGLIEI